MEDNDKGESHAISGVDSCRDVYDLSLPGEILGYNSKEEDSEGELENDGRNNIKRHESHDKLRHQSVCGHSHYMVFM